MFNIGPYVIENPVILAPMAGVTDRPFRQLCKAQGAGLVVSEMVTSDTRLWNSRKSRLRLDHHGEVGPISVQIAGGDPEMMAEAAIANVENGAQIIDINMGCPAKKVCNKAAGSALLKDEVLVNDILQAVVEAVEVPVTLKIRTGWSPDTKNGVAVANMAEQAGIQALAVHGRTRACGYKGEAEYQTIREIKQSISIPVFANGDIDTPEKAKFVKDFTGADAVMIGRAAQGKPWIFNQINHFLKSGETLADPTLDQQQEILLNHLNALIDFYGEFMGIRIARKHVGWYLQAQMNESNTQELKQVRSAFNKLEEFEAQSNLIKSFFVSRKNRKELAA